MSTVTAVPLQPTKRSYLVYLWVGIALALIAAVALARQGDDPLARNARAKGVVVTASGLQYKVIAPGKPGAAKPTDADVALVNYEGKLLNGTTFDKSQQPTPMPVTGVVPDMAGVITGVPCAIAALLLARGEIDNPGVLAPEAAIRSDRMISELRERDFEINTRSF